MRILVSIIFATALCASAQPLTAPADAAATTREHDAFWEAWRAKPPANLTVTNREYWQFQDKVFKQFAADARNFATKYPQDPRRWDGLIQSGYTPPWFITGFKPAFDLQPRETNLIIDEKALAAFNARAAQDDRDAILAGDSSSNQRRGALTWLLNEAVFAARKSGAAPDFSSFGPLMDQITEKLPDDRGAALLALYLQALHQLAPDQAAAFEARIADKPAGKLVKGLAAHEEQAHAEEMKALMARAADIGTNHFTAADGREVDFTRLRGKVVMIDFWATWCGPCMAELPNVIVNYQKYHDQGFEIVGISLENAGLSPGDTVEVKAAKLADAKKKMLDFAAHGNMPWPQYYDGRYWANEFAVKYGIHAIPATLLLDKEGHVVMAGVRGPALEQAIKTLLGI